MTHKEQIVAFHDEIEAIVTRYADEFDLPIASAIGVLEIIKKEIFAGADDNEKEF